MRENERRGHRIEGLFDSVSVVGRVAERPVLGTVGMVASQTARRNREVSQLRNSGKRRWGLFHEKSPRLLVEL